MRIIYTLLMIVIITLGLQACKKDSPQKPKAKTYLLKKLTFGSGSNNTVQEYSYDTDNRLTQTNINTDAGKYIYTYDNQNRLTKVETYNNNSLYSTQTYSYTSGAIKITEKYYDGSTGNKTFELAGNRVTRYLNYGYHETTTYSYDTKGNVSSLYITNVVDADTWNYTYDDKKHPFSMIGAPNPHLFFLEQVGAPYTNINNVISTTQGGGSKTDYVYNEDGFPVSATTHDMDNQHIYTTTFEYIVK